MEAVTPEPPQVAVVGSGYWGKNLVRNFAALGALRWICDANEATLAAQSANHPGIGATEDLDVALADDEVRGVVIAAPAVRHAELAQRALAAGKDVFVEKPLALELGEAQALVELAASRGAVLMVGHILEYHPAVVRLVELVRAGELGEVRYLYSNRLNLGRVRQEENILWSFAPHDISVMERLLGAEPESVSTWGGSYLQHGIADVTVTNLVFPGGARGHIFVSWLHPFKEQRLVVIGDRMMAVFEDSAAEGKLRLYDKGVEFSDGMPVPRHGAETVIEIDDTEPALIECRHFLDRIVDRAAPLTGGENGVAVLRVLEASQRSLDRAGAPVTLDEVTVPA